MERRERENMVRFIANVRGISEKRLMMMTDAEVEHIYETVYAKHEITE
nr:BH0509 family protein [Salsuginibacillus kocurii]